MLKKNTLNTLVLLCLSTAAAAQTQQGYAVNKHYEDGLELLNNHKYAAAYTLFAQAQKDNTKPGLNAGAMDSHLLYENAEFYKAVCALRLNNKDAERLFEKFIRNYPQNPHAKSAYFYLGNSYYLAGNFKKAIEWFTKTNQESLAGDERTEYQFKLGYSYFMLQQYDKAEPLFEQAKNVKSPWQEDAIYYFAYINYVNKDYKTALKYFEQLKNSVRYEASYPYYITSMYYLDGRYDDVLSYGLPKLNTINDRYKAEMNGLVAASYYNKGNYADAVKYFDTYNRLNNGEVKNNLLNFQYGFALHQLERDAEAITVLNRLNEDDLYLQHGMYTLGDIYLSRGDKEKAMNAYFRASRLNFDTQVQEISWLNYAKLSYELDYNQQALEYVNNFIKTFPQSKRMDQAKTLLGEVLLTNKNYQAALDILEPMPNKNKAAREAYQKVAYFRGLEFYNERAFPNALSLFLRSLEYKEDAEVAALASYWKGEAMYELFKYGEAVKAFETFLAMPAASRTNVYNYANYALGYAAFRDESYGKAATYFARFIKGDDKDINTVNDATLRLADSYFANKNYNEALAYYNQVIAKHNNTEDYATFQKGVIQGLQENYDAKLATLQGLLTKFPNSNYSDDAGFEIAYTYFNKKDYDRAKADLTALVAKYPRSSYIPRALTTIGLVQYNQDDNDGAISTFKKVIDQYPSSDEAKTSLATIKNIYVDKGDANGFLNYAGSTAIGNYTTAEQDNIMFQAARNVYLQGNAAAALEATNAYFDKFQKPIHEKEAKFMRAESLYKLKRYDEAVNDYNFILNDWTSDYTGRALVSISNLYLQQKKYNEAIVYLKRLEINSDYKADYNFAIYNLLLAYDQLGAADDMLKYAELVKASQKSAEQEKLTADLVAGKAYLLKEDAAGAKKAFQNVANNSKAEIAAEAKYNLALLAYKAGDYKGSQKICFDIIKNLASYDYWVAKAFILLADDYAKLGDKAQARSTLLSIIDNYGNKTDGVLAEAKAKLETLKK